MKRVWISFAMVFISVDVLGSNKQLDVLIHRISSARSRAELDRVLESRAPMDESIEQCRLSRMQKASPSSCLQAALNLYEDPKRSPDWDQLNQECERYSGTGWSVVDEALLRDRAQVLSEGCRKQLIERRAIYNYKRN